MHEIILKITSVSRQTTRTNQPTARTVFYLGMPVSNEVAAYLLITFIVLTGVFIICFGVATYCYCKTKWVH